MAVKSVHEQLRMQLVRWRIFESQDGTRFLMAATTPDWGPRGPLSLKGFDPRTMRFPGRCERLLYELVGPPAYDDPAQYYLETGWAVDRGACDVTVQACRDLGIPENVFAGYKERQHRDPGKT